MNNSLATVRLRQSESSLSAEDVSSPEVRNRILIVEDESVVALNLADLVTDAGFLALGPAASASEAVRALDQSRPHAAILDMVLKDGVRRVSPSSSQAVAFPSSSTRGSAGGNVVA